jgi:dynein heavy chain 1
MQASPSQEALSPAQAFDFAELRRWLEGVLSLLVSATDKQLALLFSQHDATDRITRWAKEEAQKVVYIHKTRLQTDQDGTCTRLLTSKTSDTRSDATFVLSLTTDMTYNAAHVATLALIKRLPAVIDTSRPFDTQIHVLNLFGPASADALPVVSADSSAANPYETLHSLVHLAVAPFFDAYVHSKAGKRTQVESTAKSKDADAKTGIPVTKKKFAELELSLLHLQQNVEVPDIHLSVHPFIQRTVDRCHAEGLKVSPEALDSAVVSDSTFLNKVQSEVNSWIKEIQNVTKLNREVPSGSASQEINFWLSMERALEGIDEQLKSEPIVLTLDVLRHAKRFQATVSFVADTGLKEATDMGTRSVPCPSLA